MEGTTMSKYLHGDDPRESYIAENLKVLRDRQAVELKRAAQFFGEEWDKEHGDE